jgi:hypothetical protein
MKASPRGKPQLATILLGDSVGREVRSGLEAEVAERSGYVCITPTSRHAALVFKSIGVGQGRAGSAEGVVPKSHVLIGFKPNLQSACGSTRPRTF